MIIRIYTKAVLTVKMSIIYLSMHISNYLSIFREGDYDLLGNMTEEEVNSNLYSEDGCYNLTFWQKTQV